MKKTSRQFFAFLLAVAMLFAMSATSFAATTLDANGEQGAFTSPDTPVTQAKTLVLEKEIKAYNLDETTINAPTISYTYTIAAATGSAITVTDKADKHTSNNPVTVPVKAGVGTPVISNSGIVAWTTAETLTASTDGTKNVKDISIDFSSVAFGGAGVYRYVISENLTTGTYTGAGVTGTDGAHTRYIDVYVRPASPTPAGKTAADPEFWDIYGYTCFYNNSSITDDTKTTAPVKTTGFVEGTSNGTTEVKADSYYTFNLTLSKTVAGDSFAASTHQFPFSVIFSNSAVTQNILLRTTTSGTVTDFSHDAGAPVWQGVAKIKDGGSIKYIGIPNGTDVEVYETNDMTGVTYRVETFVNASTSAITTDESVTWGTAPSTGVSQATQAAYESKSYTVDTTADADDDTAHSVAITNTLLLISPTGVVLRVAPYVVMLAAGVLILILRRRSRMQSEDDI